MKTKSSILFIALFFASFGLLMFVFNNTYTQDKACAQMVAQPIAQQLVWQFMITGDGGAFSSQRIYRGCTWCGRVQYFNSNYWRDETPIERLCSHCNATREKE